MGDTLAQSLSDIILHVVFSTKDREPLITQAIEGEFHSYICGISKHLGCPVIKINGVEDHVHILLQLARTVSASSLISELKSNSSRWIKSNGPEYHGFSWQGGFGAFSVSRPSIEGVIRYISEQKTHHKSISFKEEFIQMLKRAQIDFDEKYLWE